MKKCARELGCLLQGCLSAGYTSFGASIVKHDAAVFAVVHSRRYLTEGDSLHPPCTHKDFVLIRMTGYAPDKALRALSVLGIS